MDQFPHRWQPWLDALRVHATLKARAITTATDIADSRGVIWLTWTRNVTVDGNKEENESAEMATQALELLALVGDKDQATWRLLVQDVWPDITSAWIDADDSQVFSLGVEVNINKMGALKKLCSRFVQHDIGNVVSTAYEELRGELEAAFMSQELLPTIPIGLLLDEDVKDAAIDDESEDAPFGKMLVDVKHFVAQTQKPTKEKSRWTRLFQIQEAEVTGDEAFQSVFIFMSLCHLTAMGVRLRHLRLDLSSITLKHVETYLTMVPHSLDAIDIGQPGRPTSLQRVSSLGVDGYMSKQTYDAIFSALLTSRSIRKISVGALDFVLGPRMVRASDDRLWPWLGFVFSGHLNNALDELTLCVKGLTAADLRLFEKTLLSDDPFAMLYPSASIKRVSAIHATVSASVFHLYIPFKQQKKTKKRAKNKTATTAEDTVDFGSPVRNLRIIDVDGEWLGVLLPGWGKVWVKRSDAVLTELPVPTATMPKLSPVRHLKIDAVTDQQKDKVLALLRLAGRGLQSLTLITERPNEPTRDDWIRQVFEVCPQLQAFECEFIPLTSLETIAWCYEERSCRVEKLSIVMAPVSGVAHASRFFDYLADEDHIMTQYVRELRLTLSPNRLREVAGILESALDMLHYNQRIYLFELIVEVSEVGELEQELLDEITSYNGELIAVCLAPLAMAKKLAFLSVVNGDNDGRAPATTRALSPGVVSLIFEFAAQCRTRRVHVATKPQKTAYTFVVDSLEELIALDLHCPCCGGATMTHGQLERVEDDGTVVRVQPVVEDGRIVRMDVIE